AGEGARGAPQVRRPGGSAGQVQRDADLVLAARGERARRRSARAAQDAARRYEPPAATLVAGAALVGCSTGAVGRARPAPAPVLGFPGFRLRHRRRQPAERVEDLRLLLHLGPADLVGLRRCRRRLALVQRAAAEQHFHFLAVQRLPLEQRRGDAIEGGLMLDQQLLGPRILLGDDLAHLGVDLDGRRLGEVARPLPEFAPEEDLALLLAEE